MWLIAEGKERLRYNVRVNGIFRRPRVWYLVTPSFSPQDYSEKVATVLPRAGLLLGSPGRQRFYFFFGFGVKWKAWVYPCQLWCADRQAQGCEIRQQSLKIRECVLTLATLRELGVTLFSWSNNALRLADISIWYSDTVHPPVSTFFFLVPYLAIIREHLRLLRNYSPCDLTTNGGQISGQVKRRSANGVQSASSPPL